MKFVLSCLLILIVTEFCYSQKTIEENSEPWESEDINFPFDSNRNNENFDMNHIISYPLIKLISTYQEKISTKSIHRCIFNTSCSNFAKISIQKKGVLGLLIFMDRYFYRENAESIKHYTFILNKGVLTLDDNDFLPK